MKDRRNLKRILSAVSRAIIVVFMPKQAFNLRMGVEFKNSSPVDPDPFKNSVTIEKSMVKDRNLCLVGVYKFVLYPYFTSHIFLHYPGRPQPS